jgi:hypothetical protein
MAETVEIVRFTVNPACRDEFLRLRPAAIDALPEPFPQIEAAQAWLSTIGEVTDMSHARLVDAR